MTAFIWQRRTALWVLARYERALRDITRPGVTPLRWRAAMARASAWERLADRTGRWAPRRWPATYHDGYAKGRADFRTGRPPVRESVLRVNANYARGYSDGYADGTVTGGQGGVGSHREPS